LFATTAFAQDGRRGFWRASVVTLLAATTADAHSSFGRLEANPLLRGRDGRFDLRGVAIKGGISGGAILVQYLLLRKHPRAEGAASVANFVFAGALGGVAAYNYGRRASRTGPRSTTPAHLPEYLAAPATRFPTAATR